MVPCFSFLSKIFLDYFPIHNSYFSLFYFSCSLLSWLHLSVFQQQLFFWSLQSRCIIDFNTYFAQNSWQLIVIQQLFSSVIQWNAGKKGGKRDKGNVFSLISQGIGFTSPCFKSFLVKEERSTVVNIKDSFHAKQLRCNKDHSRRKRSGKQKTSSGKKSYN